MDITTIQVEKASKKSRRSGFYLVKLYGKTIGSFEKPYHTNEYRVPDFNKPQPIRTFSTKQKAINAIVDRCMQKALDVMTLSR